MNASDLNVYADAIAFIGNSLLSPMSQTDPVGLEVGFWDVFPDFGDGAARWYSGLCRSYAQGLEEASLDFRKAVDAVSIEFTKLFVGPPRPLVRPWESAYTEDDPSIGFGKPTFQMQKELHKEVLVIDGSSNQYADHIGIELLLMSAIARKAACNQVPKSRLASFASEHPASWIDILSGEVHSAMPDGYYDPLIALGARLVHLAE